MSNINQASRLLSAKSFISLLGAEYQLALRTGMIRRFSACSLVILIIILFTWLSTWYALNLLFNNVAVELTLAFFFCFLFTCIYIFLLNTFAKENRVKRGIFDLSNIIRIGFVIFMGYLIAQPFNIMLFAAGINPAVEEHQRKLLAAHTERTKLLLNGEMNKLNLRKGWCLYQKNISGTTAFDQEVEKIDKRITALQRNSDLLRQKAATAIARSSFFCIGLKPFTGNIGSPGS